MADCLELRVVLPTSENTTTLGKLLEQTKIRELLEGRTCEGCERADTTTQRSLIKKLPQYLIVQAPRARHMKDNQGWVNSRRSVVQKIHTSVRVPAVDLDLSSLLMSTESSEAHRYEVFGIVEHKGNG